MAANRGWLDQSWEDDPVDVGLVPEPIVPLREIEEISNPVQEKLMIHQDTPMFDENGVAKQPSQAPRPSKKKKVMEVNETQISK